jgi:hypothetical protein
MTKMMELLKELSETTDRQRIWDEILNVLGKYSDSELTNAAKLKKDDGTDVDTQVIAAVIEEIQKEKIKPLKDRVAEIGRMEIKDNGKKETSPKGSTKESGGDGQGGGDIPRKGTGPGSIRRAKGPGSGPGGLGKQQPAGE